MSVNPSPIGGYAGQFFDNNGQPLSGGKIYTYAAGTTTPQTTYTSGLGVTPHTNPIVLDSAGRVPGGEIWLTDGLVYKFVIETSTASLIGTYDNITGVNSNFVNYTVQEEVITATAGQTVFNLSTINYTPGTNSLSVYIDGVNQYVGDSYLETDSDTVTFTSGLHVGAEVKFTTAVQITTGAVDASSVSYQPPFIGGADTTVENKLAEYVSAKDFGAIGDGVADDTVALQAFFDACQNGRGYIPPGMYKITSALTLDPQYSYNIEGACYNKNGPSATVIHNAGTDNAIAIVNPVPANIYDTEIRFAHLIVTGNASSLNGFYISSTMVHFESVWCTGHGENGVYILYGFASSFKQLVCANNYQNGIFVRIAGNALHFDHCVFNGNSISSGFAGAYLGGNLPDGFNFGVVFTSCDFTGNGVTAAVGYGMVAQYCRGLTLSGCYGEGNKSYSLYIDDTTESLNITGCYWQDNDAYINNVAGLVYETNHHLRVSRSTNVNISVGLPSARYDNRIFGNTFAGGSALALTNGASDNVSIHYNQVPSGGAWKRGDIIWNNSVNSGGGLLGWVCYNPGTPGDWLQMGQIPYIYDNWLDSDATLTVGASFTTNIWRNALTVNRTVTLSNTNAFVGAKFRIVRTANSTGAATLDVGGLKSLSTAQWCDVEYAQSGWVVTAFGSL